MSNAVQVSTHGQEQSNNPFTESIPNRTLDLPGPIGMGTVERRIHTGVPQAPETAILNRYK